MECFPWVCILSEGCKPHFGIFPEVKEGTKTETTPLLGPLDTND